MNDVDGFDIINLSLQVAEISPLKSDSQRFFSRIRYFSLIGFDNRKYDLRNGSNFKL